MFPAPFQAASLPPVDLSVLNPSDPEGVDALAFESTLPSVTKYDLEMMTADNQLSLPSEVVEIEPKPLLESPPSFHESSLPRVYSTVPFLPDADSVDAVNFQLNHRALSLPVREWVLPVIDPIDLSIPEPITVKDLDFKVDLSSFSNCIMHVASPMALPSPQLTNVPDLDIPNNLPATTFHLLSPQQVEREHLETIADHLRGVEEQMIVLHHLYSHAEQQQMNKEFTTQFEVLRTLTVWQKERADVAEGCASLARLANVVRGITSQLQDQQHLRTQLVLKIDQLEATISSLQQQALEKDVNENATLDDPVSAEATVITTEMLQLVCDDLVATVRDLPAAVQEETHEEIQHSRHALDTTIAFEMMEIEMERDVVKEQLERVEALLETRTKELAEEREMALERLHTEKHHLNEEVTQLRKSLEDLQEEQRKLKAENVAIQSQLEQTMSEGERQTALGASLRQDAKVHATEMKALRRSKMQLEEKLTEVKESLASANERKNNLKQENANLKSTLKNDQEEFGRCQRKLRRLQEKVQAKVCMLQLRSELTAKETQLKELEDEKCMHEHEKIVYENDAESHYEQFHELETELHERTQEVASLQREVQQEKERVMRLEADLQRRDEEISRTRYQRPPRAVLQALNCPDVEIVPESHWMPPQRVVVPDSQEVMDRSRVTQRTAERTGRNYEMPHGTVSSAAPRTNSSYRRTCEFSGGRRRSHEFEFRGQENRMSGQQRESENIPTSVAPQPVIISTSSQRQLQRQYDANSH